jgi:hypothetical protein
MWKLNAKAITRPVTEIEKINQHWKKTNQRQTARAYLNQVYFLPSSLVKEGVQANYGSLRTSSLRDKLLGGRERKIIIPWFTTVDQLFFVGKFHSE